MDALQGVHLLPAGAYDHIIHDVFGGGDVPEALVSPAFFRLLRSKMTPTGVLSVNFYVRSVDSSVLCYLYGGACRDDGKHSVFLFMPKF